MDEVHVLTRLVLPGRGLAFQNLRLLGKDLRLQRAAASSCASKWIWARLK